MQMDSPTTTEAINLASRLWDYWKSAIAYGSIASVFLAVLEAWSNQWWPGGRLYKAFAITNDLVSRIIAINVRDKIAPRVERTRESDPEPPTKP